MAEVVFDKESQLKKIQEYLLDNEELFFVYDLKGAGAGFVGVTDKRVLFFDKTLISKKKAIIFLPFSKIATIEAHDDTSIFKGKGFFSASTLEVTSVSGATWTFDFRGSDKAMNLYKAIAARTV